MKSEKSLFNVSISKNLMQRCWPIWLLYLAVLLMAFPAVISETIRSGYPESGQIINFLIRDILIFGRQIVIASFAVSIITVMAMFSYLYSQRTCGMINSLPVRREAMFCTAYLTGLIPLIAADILAALLARAMYAGYVSWSLIFEWLGLVVMGKIAFYGFSVFCAMLTGSLFILPLVYIVIGVAADIVKESVDTIITNLVYGFSGISNFYDKFFRKMSPPLELYSMLQIRGNLDEVTGIDADTVFTVQDYSTLVFYCVLGILLSAAAMFMYKKRRMESAGDTVAIPVLKPIFKYCMAFGTALILSASVSGFLSNSVCPAALRIIVLLMLFVGAFAGWFAAEMLIRKTMKVFRYKWRGLIITWAVLAALAAVCVFDVTGYENRIPSADEIESADFTFLESAELSRRENLEKLISLHEKIINEREINEIVGSSYNNYFLGISYHLKNGSVISRNYRIAGDKVTVNDPSSVARVAQDIVNVQEAIESRFDLDKEIDKDSVINIHVDSSYRDENGIYVDNGTNLSTPQGTELYKTCIIPDIKDGTIGKKYLFDDDISRSVRTNTGISIEIYTREPDGTMKIYPNYMYIEVPADASRTVAWLEKNTDIKIMSYSEAFPETDE